MSFEERYEERLEIFKKKLETAQSNPIKTNFQVMTMGDGDVCPDCQKHDFKKLDVKDAVIGVNHPPFHKGCRCSVGYTLDKIFDGSK
ncbi:hypothetical protein B1R38_27015 [Bacillus cereus]|uniref:phage minor head protein n=1 Tax=Bacillus cereus TaxID=1396 RepID=UPI000D64B97C|nr:phage minor head protein [Bacillus cereus]PWE70240.1 hypothetical protein B1R38_27015 [Bacillus cereus]